jgi:GNAT superfamily N-acetyltransferase
MDDVKIRAAGAEEIDAALELYQWLFEPSGYRHDIGKRPKRAKRSPRPSRTSTRPCSLPNQVLVSSSESSAFRVEDLAVEPSRRSAGVGKALLDAAKAWAKMGGATHLELDTGLARTGAQRFYERENPIAKGYSYSRAR